MKPGSVEWVIFKQEGWEGPLGGPPGSGQGSTAGQESTWWILYLETQVGTRLGGLDLSPRRSGLPFGKDLSWVPVLNTLPSKASYLSGNSSASWMCGALRQKPRKAWGLKNTKPTDQQRGLTDGPSPHPQHFLQWKVKNGFMWLSEAQHGVEDSFIHCIDIHWSPTMPQARF